MQFLHSLGPWVIESSDHWVFGCLLHPPPFWGWPPAWTVVQCNLRGILLDPLRLNSSKPSEMIRELLSTGSDASVKEDEKLSFLKLKAGWWPAMNVFERLIQMKLHHHQYYDDESHLQQHVAGSMQIRSRCSSCQKFPAWWQVSPSINMEIKSRWNFLQSRWNSSCQKFPPIVIIIIIIIAVIPVVLIIIIMMVGGVLVVGQD